MQIRPDQELFGLKDPDPPFFAPNYKIYFKHASQSEQIRHDYKTNRKKLEDFNPYLSS